MTVDGLLDWLGNLAIAYTGSNLITGAAIKYIPNGDPLQARIKNALEPLGIFPAFDIFANTLSIRHQGSMYRILTTDRKDLENIAAVAGYAASSFEGKTISKKRFTQGWLELFFNNARYADADRAGGARDVFASKRKMYGMALALEVASPGTTGLETIDTLHKMSKDDAWQTERMSFFVLEYPASGPLAYGMANPFWIFKPGARFVATESARLVELGLLNDSFGLIKKMFVEGSNGVQHKYRDGYLWMFNRHGLRRGLDPNQTQDTGKHVITIFDIVAVTIKGMELCRIIEHLGNKLTTTDEEEKEREKHGIPPPAPPTITKDDPYLRSLAARLHSQGWCVFHSSTCTGLKIFMDQLTLIEPANRE